MAETPPGDEPPDNLPEATQHSSADYEKFALPEQPIRNWTPVFTTVLLIIVITALIFGGYYWFIHRSKPKSKASPVVTTSAPVSTTKSYTSPNFYLTLSYPSDWTVVDNGGGTMTITSVSISLKSSSGQDIKVKILLTITNGAQKLSGFTGSVPAAAALASQKITYSAPTQTQRADTYISFLTYSTSKTSGLDAIYITGNNGYLVGQNIPQADILQVSPVIGITFADSSGKPATIASSEWRDTKLSGPLLKMLESLSIT